MMIGWRQHALVPGPNSGWSEATAAGALQVRLVGPIWRNGALVTEVWLGDDGDPDGGQPGDVWRMCVFVVVTCLLATGLAVWAMGFAGWDGLWQKV
jgi:adenosylcobinamide-phosphate synthase